jgi:hypothetical protein
LINNGKDEKKEKERKKAEWKKKSRMEEKKERFRFTEPFLLMFMLRLLFCQS